MKLAKRIKKAIVVLLCASMVMTNVLPSFAEGNVENEPAVEEVVENETEETIEEVVEDETEETEPEEESEESFEDVEEPEESPEDIEDVEELEESPEEVEEEPDISSPSEITDEPEEEEDENIPEDMVDEPEEDEVIDEVIDEQEPMLLGSVASPSDTEEVEETEAEIEEEAEEASPSEIYEEVEEASPSELDMPMLLGAPLFGDPLPTDDCKIGSQGYATLQDGIDAVQNGETIVINKAEISYATPITINNGKTFTIDFMDGSSQRTFRWFDMMGSHTDKDVFTISGNSNVTVKNMKYLIGLGESGNRVFKVNNTGTLNLVNMTCASSDNIKDIPVVNNGGTVIVDGGDITTFTSSVGSPIVQNLNNGTTTIKGNGTYTTIADVGGVWLGNLNEDPGESPDNECGTVIIENGTFVEGPVVGVNGKGNITINNAICSGGQVSLYVLYGGVKSNITVNNITSSKDMFALCVSMQTPIDFKNGNVIYHPGMLSLDAITGDPSLSNLVIKNGKFGPDDGTTDIHDEIEGYLASGATITALSGDPDGYTYKVEAPTPECKIGSTEYATLEDAVNAVQNNQTITMLKDIGVDNTNTIEIDNGKTFTIDFNGKKVLRNQNTANGSHFITIQNGVNLTVKNLIYAKGNFTDTKNGMLFYVKGSLTLINMQCASSEGINDYIVENAKGTVVVDGGNIDSNSICLFWNSNETFGTAGGSLTIKGNGTYKTSSTYDGYVFGVGGAVIDSADWDAGTITIENGTFEGKYGFFIQGKSNIVIKNGVFNCQTTIFGLTQYGKKSKITVNNITSNSYAFLYSIQELETKLDFQNGNVIYEPTYFSTTGSSSINSVTIKNGKFGPSDGTTDIHDEIEGFLTSGAILTAISEGGYTYKVTTPLPKYLVKFDTDGGTTIASQQVEEGQKVVKPSDPTKSGYKFLGWYKTKTGSEKYNFNTTVTSAFTIYAHWEKNYVPSNNGGGSSGGGSSSGGSPKIDSNGNILGPSGIENHHDSSSAPNLTGNINVSNWNYTTSNPQAADIHYAQTIDSFVRGDNSPVVTEWVGVAGENNSKLSWYRTDATGKILKNQFIELGGNIYYLDNNGVMVTGDFQLNGVTYRFDTTIGAGEGRLLGTF